MANLKKIILKKSSLNGEVYLSGSKTSAMGASILSLLTEDDIILENFPLKMGDVNSTLNMIKSLGKSININDNTITIKERSSLKFNLDFYTEEINFTPLILAALLIRNKVSSVPLPGGCNIGNRKLDIYRYIFQKFGATFIQKGVGLFSELKKNLLPSKISLPIATTGGTIAALILASSIDGKSQIINPHLRPEIIEIINILNKMGAQIKISNSEIFITGTNVFSGARQKIMSDIMEAITFVILSGSTKGKVKINNFPFAHVIEPMKILKEAGINFELNNKNLTIFEGEIKPFNVVTGPFPEIQSDMQPIFASLAITANGKSKICDLRFKERYQYASEFQKLGVRAELKNNYLEINGVNDSLVGTEVIAKDIRCGAALLVAGINASGCTTINNIRQIERGYEDIFNKLKNLGCNISNNYS